MSDPGVVRANERYKVLAGMSFNLATGLFAAGVVQAYGARAVSVEVLGWFLISAMLIFIGWKVLGLLDSES